METRFRYRAYGKSELAQLYYPFLSSSHARRLFNRELQACRQLSATLRRQAWHPHCRVFSPRQVQTVVRFLGEP